MANSVVTEKRVHFVTNISAGTDWTVLHKCMSNFTSVYRKNHVVFHRMFVVQYNNRFVLHGTVITDLCWNCQKRNTYQIHQSKNLPVAVKQAKLKKHEEHLRIVDVQRSRLRSMIDEAKDTVKLYDITLSRNDPCSRDMKMHYSFDFAQQVHFANSPNQVGPLYFPTPRKCACVWRLLWRNSKTLVNYLIDEGAATSKGSNAVISYLHHFFENYTDGVRRVLSYIVITVLVKIRTGSWFHTSPGGLFMDYTRIVYFELSWCTGHWSPISLHGKWLNEFCI